MIISNKAAVQRVTQMYQEQKKETKVQKKAENLTFHDQVSLSTEGKELQAVLQKLKSTPEIRPQADEIKVAVQSGTYEISAREVAQSILTTWGRS